MTHSNTNNIRNKFMAGCKFYIKFIKRLERTDPELFDVLCECDDTGYKYDMNLKTWSLVGLYSWSAFTDVLDCERSIPTPRCGEKYEMEYFNMLWITFAEYYRNNHINFRNSIIMGLL